jgi:hypothetical protein
MKPIRAALFSMVLAGAGLVVSAPQASAGGECTDLYGKSSWQACAEQYGVECEKFGQGTLGSGWDCHYPDGSHDDCVKIDVVEGTTSGSCEHYARGVMDPDGHDH